jgi:3-hydroxybutyrate dehydrogenase
MKLDGKVAIITGAASGIGREIARTFAREGAHVVITDLNVQQAQVAAEEIGKTGPKAMAVAMDVTDEQGVNRGVDDAASKLGRIDVLVSNAGIQIVHPIEEFPFGEWKKMLAIHLDGAFLTTKACLPYMYKSGGGSIIYMGSVHSKEASLLKAAYVTAKHGLIGLAKVVAKEGAKHGVRANVVCPGFVKTPLVEKQIPEQARDLGLTEQQVVKQVMLKDTVDGEFTTTLDVAEVALLFASFPSNALTGQSLVVSHGWFMQ